MGQIGGKAKGAFVRFFVLAGVVAIVVLGVYLLWSSNARGIEVERRALAEARTLSTEIGAAWDYIDSIQPQQLGIYEDPLPRGVYCVVAAKNIAERFSEQSAYSIRYVRVDPRNKDDAPDDYERQALALFDASDETECYSLEDDGGTATFRYLSKLVIDEGCLSCHGDPAGEKDVMGYFKEGMAVGDTGGAVSIVMPMDAILADADADMASTVTFFCVLMGTMGVLLAVALRRWVARPILTENERLVQVSEEQSKLLAVVSHELKTPLSAILAFTEIWKADRPNQVPSDEEIVAEVEANGQVLFDMVSNLLDAAKLEAGAVSLAQEELDVYDVVARVRSTMDALAAKRGVAFSIDVSPGTPIVRGDPDVLRRIAVNLVSNALRFTDEGGSIDLRFDYVEHALVTTVRDTGVGIGEEQLPRLFDRFVGTPGSENTGEGGAGLGLFIVKSYADMMGGSVSVESAVGKGSTFVVRLPLPPLGEPAEGEDAE